MLSLCHVFQNTFSLTFQLYFFQNSVENKWSESSFEDNCYQHGKTPNNNGKIAAMIKISSQGDKLFSDEYYGEAIYHHKKQLNFLEELDTLEGL